MEEYSLALALFDYLPVAVSALGLSWLALLVGGDERRMQSWCLFGVALVIAGGLSKASWKLLWVLTGEDITVLANLLFILMAPGMVLLATHCYRAQRLWRNEPHGPVAPWQAAMLIILPVYLAAGALYEGEAGSRAWFFILLGCASLANIAISGMLVRYTWSKRQHTTALLYLLSICLILGLSGLSRVSAGSAPLQWLAEALNLMAHGSFALATWRIRAVIPIRDTRV